MKILKNKKSVVILILLFAVFLCGCSNNRYNTSNIIKLSSFNEKVNEYFVILLMDKLKFVWMKI